MAEGLLQLAPHGKLLYAYMYIIYIYYNISVQTLSHVQLFATP